MPLLGHVTPGSCPTYTCRYISYHCWDLPEIALGVSNSPLFCPCFCPQRLSGQWLSNTWSLKWKQPGIPECKRRVPALRPGSLLDLLCVCEIGFVVCSDSLLQSLPPITSPPTPASPPGLASDTANNSNGLGLPAGRAWTPISGQGTFPSVSVLAVLCVSFVPVL